MSAELVEISLRLLAVMLLVLLNGFFVAAEFALVSVRRTRIQELVEEGSSSARRVMKAHNNLSSIISAAQIGITLASLALGWIGEPAIASLLRNPLTSLGLGEAGVHTVAIVIAFSLITFMHVVIGETVPKAVALQRPEKVAMWTVVPLSIFSLIISPASYLLNLASNVCMKILKMEPGFLDQHSIHSEEELKILVSQSSKGGVLQDTEQEMLYNVFDFADKQVAEVMIPRPDVICLDLDQPVEEILHIVSVEPYTRYPVYQDQVDNVVGILHTRDLFNHVQQKGIENTHIQPLLRPAHIIPESKSLVALLADFRRSKSHLALVVDEYGSLAGIVTLENLIEEIVGEIDDEHDVPETEPFERISEFHFRFEGMFLIDDFNERFDTSIPNGDFHTLAGFVFSKLGRQPVNGDVIEHENTIFEVTKTDGPRILSLDIKLPKDKS